MLNAIIFLTVTLSYLKHWRPKRNIDYIADLIRTRKLCIFYSTQCSPLLLKLFHTDFNKSKPMAYLFLVFLVCCMTSFWLVFIEYMFVRFSPQEVGGGILCNPTWGSSFQKGHLSQASKACKREKISQVEIYKRMVGKGPYKIFIWLYHHTTVYVKLTRILSSIFGESVIRQASFSVCKCSVDMWKGYFLVKIY